MNAITKNQRSPSRWWALGALGFCLLVINLDMTVLNVALPTLARDMQATDSQLQWMVDAYTLVYASLVLLGGSMGDRFGRKRMLMIGLLVFGIGSLWSAFSGSANGLILARGFMAIGGALIMPGTLSLVANIFVGKERAQAIGITQGIMGLGIVIGPLIGGFLLEHFSWGVIFLINVPVVLFTVPICFWLVPESKDPHASRMDLPGALSSITGLFALLYGIIEVPTYGLGEARILFALGVAVVLLAGFVIWERHTTTPMLNLTIFRNPAISAAIVALTLASLGMTGGLFFLTQYLQLVLNETPMGAGLSFTPFVLGLLVTSVGLSPLLDHRIGTKLTVSIGLFLSAGSIALLTTLDMHTSAIAMAGMLALLGAGLGISMVPATNAIMGTLPLNQAGVGSAATDTAQQVGNALGVALLGSILAAAYQANMDAASAIRVLPAPLRAIARDSLGRAVVLASQMSNPGAQTLRNVARSAFVAAIGPTVLIGAIIVGCGALVALFFLPRRISSQPDQTATEAPKEAVLS